MNYANLDDRVDQFVQLKFLSMIPPVIFTRNQSRVLVGQGSWQEHGLSLLDIDGEASAEVLDSF